MSEEDKKFLNKFKNEIYFRTNASFDVIEEMEGTEEKEAALKYHGDLHHLVYIIEKLQKENEELNRKFKVQLETNLRLVDARNGIENEEIRQLNNFIKNDCILKDKIEEIKNKNIGQYMNFYRGIEELLEED